MADHDRPDIYSEPDMSRTCSTCVHGRAEKRMRIDPFNGRERPMDVIVCERCGHRFTSMPHNCCNGWKAK